MAFARSRAAFRAVDNQGLVALITTFELRLAALPYATDRPEERRRLAAEAEEAWTRATGLQLVPHLGLVRLPLLLLDGQWAEARRVAMDARRSELKAIQAYLALRQLGALARDQGEPALARAVVVELLPDGPATRPDDVPFVDFSALQRLAALLAVDAGDLGAARTWLEAHDRWLEWNGTVLGRAEGQLAWAVLHRAAGDSKAARRHAQGALAHATDPHQPLALLAAHRLLGELDTTAGHLEGAAAHLDAALALAEACAAPYEHALTLLALAGLRGAAGQPAAAPALLAEARATCASLGATPALAQIEALAARLTPTPTAWPRYPAGLSAREVEVLRLVAAGRSNRDIAAALNVSPATVNNHVAHILAKTNADNRAAAAAFALRHGLA